MSAGVAIILALAGGVLIVMGARGTYPDVWDVLMHPATNQGSEQGVGIIEPTSEPGPTHKE